MFLKSLIHAAAALAAVLVLSPTAVCAASSSVAPSSPDDFLVRGLEEAVPQYADFDGTMYAGMMPVAADADADADAADADTTADASPPDSSLFFWLFLPTTPTVDDTLVIWLNGGPGCSSMVGLMFENGPVVTPPMPAGTARTEERPELVTNPYAWTEATAMMYVEQPVGTGFSKGPREPQTEEDLSQDFYGFLTSFFDTFPDLRSRRLFMFGESYAGYYVPSIARYVHRQNKELPAASPERMNLAGVGLGNGWIDPIIQGRAVIDYAYWHGMIDQQMRQSLHAEFTACTSSEGRTEEQPPPFHPYTTPDECGMMGAVLEAAGGGSIDPTVAGSINTYDVTTWDIYPTLFSVNGTVTSFFNKDPRVREALNAPREATVGDLWLECIPGAGRRRRSRRLEDFTSWAQQRQAQTRQRRSLHLLDDDQPASVVPYIAELLDDAGIRVLAYNGDRDMSCCSQGTEECLAGMDWSGREKWADPEATRRGLWTVKGPRRAEEGLHQEVEVGGYAKSHGNLTFLVVYNSGHMVPTNRPRAALDLLERFLRGESFSDAKLPVFSAEDSFPASEESLGSDAAGGGGEGEFSRSQVALISVLCAIVGGVAAVFVADRVRGKQASYERIPNASVPGTPGADGISLHHT